MTENNQRTIEGSYEFLDDIKEYMSLFGNESEECFNDLTLESISHRKVRLSSVSDIKSTKKTYKNQEVESLSARKSEQLFKKDEGLSSYVEEWVKLHGDIIKKLGIKNWQELTPYQIIILANAIVNESVTYDPNYSEEDTASGEILDKLSIVELLANGQAHCRHFAEATEFVFKAIKSFQTGENVEGCYCVRIFSQKDREMAPESDASDHAYNLFLLSDRGGNLKAVITDPTWSDKNFNPNSPQGWENRIDYMETRIFGAVNLLEQNGILDPKNPRNEVYTREWLNNNFKDRVYAYLSYLRVDFYLDFVESQKKLLAIFKQIKSECTPEQQVLLYASFGNTLDDEEKLYFDKLLQEINAEKLKDLLSKDKNSTKFWYIECKKRFGKKEILDLVTKGFGSFEIFNLLQFNKKIYFEAGTSKGGMVEQFVYGFIQNFSLAMTKLHSTLLKSRDSQDFSALKSMIIVISPEKNPFVELSKNLLGMVNAIAGYEKLIDLEGLKKVIAECVEMVDDLSKKWEQNEDQFDLYPLI